MKEAAMAAAADEAVADSLEIELYGGSMSAGGSNGSGGSDGGGGVGGVGGVRGVRGGSEALGEATTAPLRTAVEVTLHGGFDLESAQASIAHRPTHALCLPTDSCSNSPNPIPTLALTSNPSLTLTLTRNSKPISNLDPDPCVTGEAARARLRGLLSRRRDQAARWLLGLARSQD